MCHFTEWHSGRTHPSKRSTVETVIGKFKNFFGAMLSRSRPPQTAFSASAREFWRLALQANLVVVQDKNITQIEGFTIIIYITNYFINYS
jgi:hypothetical protein